MSGYYEVGDTGYGIMKEGGGGGLCRIADYSIFNINMGNLGIDMPSIISSISWPRQILSVDYLQCTFFTITISHV